MFFPIQNTKYKIRDTRLKGFTLIEALVFLFIFSLISVVFYETYSVGTRTIIESKNRLGATALANQKMEIIRSIAYDDIGTTSGIPAGTLAEDEAISVNTTRYNVHTYVQYADDSFDGTVGGSPNDAIPNDYKQVRLTVSWGTGGDDQKVVIFGNFSPNGIETPAGGGVLSVNVLDAGGSGVVGASVRVRNPSASVDFTASTDSTGNITSVGAPAGSQNYELTVSKSGYYGAQTYAPTATFTPIDVHASVVDAVLNQATIVMDQYADIEIRSEDPFGTDVAGVDMDIEGGRHFGTDTALAHPEMYSFSDSITTNASGAESIADQSYGTYTVSNVSKSGFTFYKLSPDGPASNQFSALAGVSNTVSVLMLDDAVSSLWVKVNNQAAPTEPVSNATVHLTETVSGYDTTLLTDAFGYAFFPTVLPALVAGTYDLEVTAAGFVTETGTVSIGGSALVTETVSLQPE
jgi:type II secretory pathway pseudopilin PulG